MPKRFHSFLVKSFVAAAEAVKMLLEGRERKGRLEEEVEERREVGGRRSCGAAIMRSGHFCPLGGRREEKRRRRRRKR